MMGPTHALSGAAGWVAACCLPAAFGMPPTPFQLAVGASMCALGALGPDIDHPRSMISRGLGPITGALSWAVRQCTCHRGATHDLRCAAAVTAILGGLAWALGAWWVGIAFGVGWLVHILGDALTMSGVRMLGGRCVRLLGPLSFRTGGKVEGLLAAPVFAGALGLALWFVLPS